VSKGHVETYKLDTSRDELITVIYNRYGRKLYSYAAHSWKVSEDIAWELIYKTIYKTIDSYKKYAFKSEEKFASFVFRIFINYLRNHYRDNKNENIFSFSGIDDVDLDSKETPAERESVNLKLNALNEELEKMEEWQRMLLLMRSEGRPYSEIAEYVSKPESQLKVYYQRLKEQITRKLNERK
jgi:RNA polymerase sigma factor (sigma-70 family)